MTDIQAQASPWAAQPPCLLLRAKRHPVAIPTAPPQVVGYRHVTTGCCKVIENIGFRQRVPNMRNSNSTSTMQRSALRRGGAQESVDGLLVDGLKDVPAAYASQSLFRSNPQSRPAARRPAKNGSKCRHKPTLSSLASRSALERLSSSCPSCHQTYCGWGRAGVLHPLGEGPSRRRCLYSHLDMLTKC
jgi:hypothetical protein